MIRKSEKVHGKNEDLSNKWHQRPKLAVRKSEQRHKSFVSNKLKGLFDIKKPSTETAEAFYLSKASSAAVKSEIAGPTNTLPVALKRDP
jgi:hypothetical protein